MSERAPSVELTLLKRSAEGGSSVRRGVGNVAVEVVVGLQLPDHAEVMLYGYTPTGNEATEVTHWPEDRAANLHGYFNSHLAQPDDDDIDCFGMVDAAMGWGPDDMGTFTPEYVNYFGAYPGEPLIITDSRTVVHTMMGIDRRGYSLSILGKRSLGGGVLAVAGNRQQMKAYGGRSMSAITDRPLVD